jgi:hypothetical protein
MNAITIQGNSINRKKTDLRTKPIIAPPSPCVNEVPFVISEEPHNFDIGTVDNPNEQIAVKLRFFFFLHSDKFIFFYF